MAGYRRDSQVGKIKAAEACVQRNGGRIRHLRKAGKIVSKTVMAPKRPGIKVLGALDCLANYGGYYVIKEL